MNKKSKLLPLGAMDRRQVTELVDLCHEMVHWEAAKWERGEDISGPDLVNCFAHWRSRLMALVGE